MEFKLLNLEDGDLFRILRFITFMKRKYTSEFCKFCFTLCGVLLCNVLYTVLCLFTYLLYYLHVFYSLISILNILLACHFRSLSSIILFIFPLSSIYLPYLPLSVLFFCLSCTLFRTSIFIDFAKLERNVKSL